LDPFTDEQWQYVIETMAEQAVFSAKLLAGEMPHNIEEVFTANGLSLFPFTKFDIHSRCSCPDPANPCKHIGAVYYLLGDRFSEDPFVLFLLRGRTKDQIIEALRQIRSTGKTEISEGDADLESPIPLPPHQPPLQIDQFWHYSEQLEPSLVVIAPPPGDETVLDVLGPLPIKVENAGSNSAAAKASAQAAIEHLKALYTAVRQQAILTAMNASNETLG
jgi:uncharacterized Zn finger protein